MEIMFSILLLSARKNPPVFWKRFLFSRKYFRVLKTFKVPNDCFKRSPISQTKDYFEKCFPVKRQRQTQVLPQNLLTGAPVHFLSIWWINFLKNPYSLTSDSQCVELNWLCKHMKKVRRSQASMSRNTCAELIKKHFFPVS